MHKIKRTARRNAWYNNFGDDGIRTYNVFGRANTRPKRVNDEENHLRRTQSESACVPPIDRQYEPPHRSSTLPASFGKATHQSQAMPTTEKVSKIINDEKASADEQAQAHGVRRRTLGPKLKAFLLLDKYPQFGFGSMLKAILGSWLNIMLVFVPAGFALNYTHQSPVAVFVINFFAIIPSNNAIAFAIEEINSYTNDTLGALLSMTFSNAVQLDSSILLLKTRQVPVLRSSLLGGILQNLLVMLGLAFLAGGYRRQVQYFNSTIAQTIGMLLLLAVLSLTIPTVSQLWGHSTMDGIIAQSRGTAVIIMFSYILWLAFQLKTNRELFRPTGEKVPRPKHGKKDDGETMKGFAMIGAAAGAATAGGKINQDNLVQDYDNEEDEYVPQTTPLFALGTLVIFTALLAFNTQFATDSVQGIMSEHGVSEMFMGIVVLPILSNDPMTIYVAYIDKMDMSIALTLERCMQTALMIVPLIVLIAWGLGVNEMTLDFDGFSIAALFASIIIVTYAVQEGKSNWSMGALLLKVFIIIGLASFYID